MNEKVWEMKEPFPTYKTQMKTAAEMRQRKSIPTFLRPANLQIQRNNLSFSFSLSIFEGLRPVPDVWIGDAPFWNCLSKDP